MKRVLAILGSLKITVGLLVVILFVLAAGTIIESLHDAAAARVVYGSAWFYVLLGAFAVNLVAALLDRWPYGRYRIGFLITHASMLVILAGALATLLFKVEGRIGLWEGQTTSTATALAKDGSVSNLDLGFAVRLDDFQIDVYPGSGMPAMYRSRVTVIDPEDGSQRPAVIEMNRELSHGGYKLFQVSYNIVEDGEMTVLSVSRGHGQAIVFVGYVLLVDGMLSVLATRIAQRLKGGGPPRRWRQRARKVPVASAALSGCAAVPRRPPAFAVPTAPNWLRACASASAGRP